MRTRDRVSIAVGAAALFASVALVGSVHRQSQAVIAALVAVALAFQVLTRRRFERVSPLLVLLAVPVAISALQLVPLPRAVLHVLDATGQQLREDGAALSGTSPWQSISLDPPATLRELSFFVILFGVAVLALRMAVTERGRYWLLASVALLCGTTALITGAHTLLGADSLYGIYEPDFVKGAPIFGPLLNPNHLGSLMSIGAALSIGLAFYPQQKTQWRIVWVFTAIASTIVVAASYSRGALIALALAVLVLIASAVAERLGGRGRRARFRNDIPMVFVIAGGLFVGLYLAGGTVLDQLDSTSMSEIGRPTSKFEAWRSSLALVREAPLVGIGRGATESVLPRVHPASGRATFEELENEYLTAAVEWGIPVALALLVILAWAARIVARRWRDGPLAAAATAALAAVMFQSAVDFGIELLGIAMPVTLIAATLLYVPIREAPDPRGVRIRRGILVFSLLAVAFILISPLTRTAREDHLRITGDVDTRWAASHSSLERHPLDYLSFGEAAAAAQQRRDAIAVRYLNHALRLHPTHGGLHRLAANMLLATDRPLQAAGEYAKALEVSPTPRRLLLEIVKQLERPEIASFAIPLEYPKREVILRGLEELHRTDIAIAWMRRVVDHDPADLALIDRLYSTAMDAHDLDAARHAAQLRRKASNTTTSRLMWAKVLFQRREFGLLAQELSDVAEWTGRMDQKAEAWLLRCDLFIQQVDWDAALECLHELDASGLLLHQRNQITQRLQRIQEKRAAEATQQAIQEMERSIREEKNPK